MGIGGSGMSGVAMIAKSQGYEVSGCDLNIGTPYIDKLKESGIKIYKGQSEDHLEKVDIIAVTPAVFFQNEKHPEILLAKQEDKLMTWQEFLGKYLQKDKEVICIAGTHGKSTTTAMASILFEKAGLDPNVMIGANVKEWGANYRTGKENIFITEADEFFDNFLNYSSDVVVLNNIEFDHPDYFKDENQIYGSFEKFIMGLKGKKILICNMDDFGVKKLLSKMDKNILSGINLYPYSTKNKKIKLTKDFTEFEVDGKKFRLKVPGGYNVSNALGVIALGKIYKISMDKIKKALENFEGIGRRMELIGEDKNVKVYDDYAHHPTAIKKTLGALRQKYPEEKIWAIIEPHTFSRTKALLPLYKNVFDDADEVIIAPIFRSRDTEDFGITGNDIAKVSGHKNIHYLDSFDEIITFVKKRIEPNGVVIVMGAGESYKLARSVLNSLL